MPANDPPHIPNRVTGSAQPDRPSITARGDELSLLAAHVGMGEPRVMDINMAPTADHAPKPDAAQVKALLDAAHASPPEATAILAREFGAEAVPTAAVEGALNLLRDDPFRRARVIAVMAEAQRPECAPRVEKLLGSRLLAECAQGAISLLYIESSPDRGFRELRRIVGEALSGQIERQGYPLDWICEELNRFGSAESMSLSDEFYGIFQASTGK